MEQNYYGSLCAKMYEILHQSAPQDELDFYLSYAQKEDKILEPMCGSGRFLIPFMEKGLRVSGIDASSEMLCELKRKAPGAQAVQANLLDELPEGGYDYIFITSGSVSLFTDMEQCKNVLRKVKNLLNPRGKFVFAVDTVANRCEDTEERIAVSVKTEDGFDLVLKNKNRYDENSQTQFSPGRYELYRDNILIQSEDMDFQTHLYRFGEMEELLKEIGFSSVTVYSSFQKEVAKDDNTEMFLYECKL